MTRRAYLNERQRAYRWRSQVKTHLARLEELLTGAWPDGQCRRPPDADIPPLSDALRWAISREWGLQNPNEPPF